MFVDKQKLERACLDELTKIGNLFDTLKINYCVFGEYALLAHNIKTGQPQSGVIFSEMSSKEKIIEMLFKMNFTIYSLEPEMIKAKKSTVSGDLRVDILLGSLDNKTFIVNFREKPLILSKEIFDRDTSEVWGHLGGGKSGKGFFRAASLEEIYFTKMNSANESDINDLEIIKGSGKVDLDKLFKIFKKNGLV